MIKIRDINSTSNASKDIDGNVIHIVRDSLLAESLLSVIIGLTILSVLLLIKCYVMIIDVSMYPTFVTLIVPVLHTFIRRIRINLQFPIFIITVLTSAIFYFAVISIPFLEFGNSEANRFYLAAILVIYTLFSTIYRLKPTFTAGDQEFIVFPLAIHIIFYLLFIMAERKEIAQNIIINVIIIIMLFVVMRQIAVFDSRYYHTIHKSNKPATLLKKQNTKTVIGLIAVVAVAWGVLAILPIETLSRLLLAGIRVIFGLLSFLFKPGEDNGEIDYEDPMEGFGDFGVEGQYNPWVDLAGKVVAIILIIGVILFILNTIRLLIQNAPKFTKKRELTEDDNLVDTIEDIKPEKKPFITRGPDFGTGHERRIRKQFYNKARRAMKKGLPIYPSSTPGQIEKVILANGDKEIAPLRQEYEKVRYGSNKT
ncbi:MAG: hypothetical protein IKE92_13150 [Clostridiales bacterium]|nr:hypothetical protein [Clostridiales bacterium]